ncbi:MAG TPA: hypothetical protein VML50_00855 [Anaeromyxobacter sp.]|nr:hypothetical protein [Anaeromyxobacter sp.]
MKTRARNLTRRTGAPRRLVTTLGELVSAAYEAVPGIGARKRQQALVLLTRSALARHMSPHVVFVR